MRFDRRIEESIVQCRKKKRKKKSLPIPLVCRLFKKVVLRQKNKIMGKKMCTHTHTHKHNQIIIAHFKYCARYYMCVCNAICI